MTLTALTHARTGLVILGVGAILLPFLAPGSELLLAIALLGLGALVWSWRTQNRWYAGVAGIFIWTLIGFHLREVAELAGAAVSLVVLMLAAASLALWQLEASEPRTLLLLALAAGIVTLELFLVLLFWPINFSSRALLITMSYALALELIDLARRRALSLRALAPSLGITGFLTYVLVTTADWFGF